MSTAQHNIDERHRVQPQPLKVWIMAERDEDHGTDVDTPQSVHLSEEGAKQAQRDEEDDHEWPCESCEEPVRLADQGWRELDGNYVCENSDSKQHLPDKGDWCLCCRKDWAVDGPYEVQA